MKEFFLHLFSYEKYYNANCVALFCLNCEKTLHLLVYHMFWLTLKNMDNKIPVNIGVDNMKKKRLFILSGIVALITNLSTISISASTYASAELYSGTYMTGTINCQTYSITGKTVTSGDNCTVTVYAKAYLRNGNGFVDAYNGGTNSTSATASSSYSLYSYSGNHTAQSGAVKKTIGTYYNG